jgi:alkylation response protein AidB-like acyl-CoA dehydrogenase
MAPGGPTWFVVERDTEGLGHGRPEDKHGIRASNTARVSLDDVFVPVEQLLGGVEGEGLEQAQRVFGFTRLMVAAFGLGAGWEALDRAIAFSVDRVQGGGPLCEKQGYTHKLIVPHAVRLEAGRAVIDHGFKALGLAEIIALALPENAASIRVMEKLGMTPAGTIDYGGLTAVKYRIRRPTTKGES